MIVELNSISTISVLLLSPIKSQQPGHDSSICLVFLVLTVWGELCLISLESTLVNKPTLIVSRSSGARSWSHPRPHRPTRLREQTRIQSGCLPLSSTFWQVNIQMQTHAPPPPPVEGGRLGRGARLRTKADGVETVLTHAVDQKNDKWIFAGGYVGGWVTLSHLI